MIIIISACSRVSEQAETRSEYEQEIEDLLALLKFITYPSDVLSLTSILKSPIFGFSDSKTLDFCLSLKRAPNSKNLLVNLNSYLSNIPEYQKTQTRLSKLTSILYKTEFLSTASKIGQVITDLCLAETYQISFGGKEF